jgi:hypothetical protein
MVSAHPGDAVSPWRRRDAGELRTADGREFLQRVALSEDARERIEIAPAMIDAIDAQIAPPATRTEPAKRGPKRHSA